MQTLIHDLRYGFRMVLKNPVASGVVVLSLAIGIGANTAIFTLINATMLKSLPVENPAQLVLFNDSPSEGEASGDQTGHWEIFSYPLYLYFQKDRQFFQDLCAFRSGEDRLSVRIQDAQTGEPAHEASGHLVSGNYFGVMGVNAILVGYSLLRMIRRRRGPSPLLVTAAGSRSSTAIIQSWEEWSFSTERLSLSWG
ncbi:MAG TPA: hypothetical protein VGQ81_11420 [Acidobacteriota bacterium]|jgi:hypothetical protein|nr:hypothetical protein [Acidobacteriota bacterium]